MTYIRAWMSSKFGQIRSGTTELAALEHLKTSMLPLFLVSQLRLYLGHSQVSVYRTIGPLVEICYAFLYQWLCNNVISMSFIYSDTITLRGRGALA